MAAKRKMTPEKEKAHKEHMADITAKAARAYKLRMLENVRLFQQKSAEYFNMQDDAGLAYSEAGLASAAGWLVSRLQRYYDANDHNDDEFVEAQISAFEAGAEPDDATAVMSYFVRMAYQRIQEQIDTSPIYQEKGMVTRGIFLNKQKRFGGYQDKQEAKQDVRVNVTFGDGSDPSDYK